MPNVSYTHPMMCNPPAAGHVYRISNKMLHTHNQDCTSSVAIDEIENEEEAEKYLDDFHSCFEEGIEGYSELITNLKESGRLINLVVYADWENTNEDGFTYVNLRISKNGMEQEYAQFS